MNFAYWPRSIWKLSNQIIVHGILSFGNKKKYQCCGYQNVLENNMVDVSPFTQSMSISVLLCQNTGMSIKCVNLFRKKIGF